MYRHKDHQGQEIDLSVGKVVCVGRNYLDHIKELNNPKPDHMVLFMKPATALVDLSSPIHLPEGLGPCHNELEIALLIKSPLCKADAETAMHAVWGVGLGLDLTLRELQSSLKQQGLPWERAKGFDKACPMSGFVAKEAFAKLNDLDFSLKVNGQLRQQGNSRAMIWDMPTLLAQISQTFTLLPGDIVMTGTPKGVSALLPGDSLEAELSGHMRVASRVE